MIMHFQDVIVNSVKCNEIFVHFAIYSQKLHFVKNIYDICVVLYTQCAFD